MVFNPETCKVVIKGRKKRTKVLTDKEQQEMKEAFYTTIDDVFMLDELDYDPLPEMLPNNRRKQNDH